MPLYAYIKSEPKEDFWDKFANDLLFFAHSVKKPRVLIPRTQKRRILSGFLVGIGLFLLGNGIFPMVFYRIKYVPNFSQILSPVPGGRTFSNLFEATAQEGNIDNTFFSSWLSEEAIDTLSVDSWSSPVDDYFISVPKAEIINAKVLINSDDLKKSLVHLKGTALPGQKGNAVISGHSVSPQFFNPKIYMTIFSNLYKLKENDEIIVVFDGIEYHYFVEEIFETKPTNLSVIEQRFNNKYLTLITCPMGDYSRRLIVRARLI